ncbi:hypothetical protein Pfo_005474 [Paulownia fortunei]|nr:hypothetical protein Pfo_005474 [Paulownia fortunei]
MTHKIHVLLVEHDSKDHDKTMNMLQYFSYEVKLASTGLSILSKGKAQFDIVMANMNSPDSYGFQLLQDAIKMNFLVILMTNDDDAITTMRALEQGAFLCIKKPVTMQIMGYLWQHVLREKVRRLKQKKPIREVIEHNTLHKEFREEDLMEGNQNDNHNAEGKHKSKKKLNSGTSQNDNAMFKKKVWTEWTEELHEKFLDAVTQLGEGRCYPKEILELMNIPGLTRMQVASHLQKCRNAKWLPPNERKSKLANTEMTPRKNKAPRAKTARFGSMPHLDKSSEFHLRIQKYHEMNHDQEFTIDPHHLGDNHDGSSNNGYHPQLLLDHGNSPFAQDNETFSMGQLGQPFHMDEPFMYGAQNITPSTNISLNQRDFPEDAFEFPSMDSMVQTFSTLQQELGMDYNGSFQSLVLDQIPIVTNETNQWSPEVPKLVNDQENEGQMREG